MVKSLCNVTQVEQFMKRILMLAAVFGMASFAALVLPCSGADATVKENAVRQTRVEGEGNEPCVTVYRTIPAGNYTPGEPLTVVIRAESNCSDTFGSLGIIEKIPLNWSFVSVTAIAGEAPPISPREGQTQFLDFAWINVPELPVELQYTIKPDLVSDEPLVISGYAIYFFSVNGEHRSATVETGVEAVSGGEGEGRGEGEGEGEDEEEGEGEGAVSIGCCRYAAKSTKSGFDGNFAGVFTGDSLLLILVGAALAWGAYAK